MAQEDVLDIILPLYRHQNIIDPRSSYTHHRRRSGITRTFASEEKKTEVPSGFDCADVSLTPQCGLEALGISSITHSTYQGKRGLESRSIFIFSCYMAWSAVVIHKIENLPPPPILLPGT